MAQRKNPNPTLVSSCLDFLESLGQAGEKLCRVLRGTAKTGRDAQAAYESLRDSYTRAKELWYSTLAFLRDNEGGAQPC
ncbi:hypothetical protein [Streptomyces sp. YIM 132580]|uniref:hypothetical protein n=1 Tax=Streptomyces sp. YIM 132580 TaxID=2691958 RepID=UPI001368C74B|nr:hypothetical protein [Streptomyces sp. YIM 132580]MXG30191.1 hypothetical protein [Streptomyces sp. YIM 132580]